MCVQYIYLCNKYVHNISYIYTYKHLSLYICICYSSAPQQQHSNSNEFSGNSDFWLLNTIVH